MFFLKVIERLFKYNQILQNKAMLLALLLLITIVSPINKQCDPPENSSSAPIPMSFLEPCPLNSHCLPNGFCECDQGFIGKCTQEAFRMEDQLQVNTTITNENYTFFEVLGDPQQYIFIQYSLCHLISSSITEIIDVWEDSGLVDIFSKENAIPGGKVYPVRQGCITLNTPLMKFGNKPSGQMEGFIFGLKLATAGQIPISLTVSIELFDFWGLMTKLLLIIGGCFLLTLCVAIGYIIYKWRRRQLFYRALNQPKDIKHFQKYLPKFKMSKMSRQNLDDDTCSVCLLQFEDKWIRKTICGHIFHQDCLDQWCKTNLSCPICRKSLELSDLKNELSTNETINDSLRQSLID